MAGRRFNFGDEDEYIATRFSPRVAKNFSFEENDERFDEPSIGQGYQGRQKEKESDPYDDIITRYKNILGEEQPALRRYRETMQNMPKRQDYDLGKWGRVGAALAGFGAGYRDPMEGVKVATTLREQPYRQAQADYESNLNNLGQEVEFEAKDRSTKMKGLDLELEGYRDRVKAQNQRRLDESLINRRDFQNKNDELKTNMERDKLRLSESEFNLKYADIMHDNRLADELGRSTIDYRNRTAATGEANARTSQGQLNLGQNRFDFESGPKFGHEQRMDFLNLGQDIEEEKGRNKRDATGSQSWLTPSAQDDAHDSALAEIKVQFPGYRKFFKETAPGYAPELKDNLTDEQLNSPEWAAFQRELTGRAGAKLNRARSGGRRFEEVK